MTVLKRGRYPRVTLELQGAWLLRLDLPAAETVPSCLCRACVCVVCVCVHTHTHTHTQVLDQDSNVNAADDAGRTALHLAAANGHDKIVKLLGPSKPPPPPKI